MLTSMVKKLFGSDDQLDYEAIEWALQCHMTPDNWKLEQYIRQLVFVPCDMKKGGNNHHLIKDFINGPSYEDAYTSKEYTFWKKDLGGHSFPIVLPGDYRPDSFLGPPEMVEPIESAPIKGELYFIPGSHVKELDKHRVNGVQFTRDRVNIRIPYRTVAFNKERPLPVISDHQFFSTVQAWMYVGVKDYWNPQIGGIFKSQMDLYEHDKPRVWIKRFYQFRTNEAR